MGLVFALGKQDLPSELYCFAFPRCIMHDNGEVPRGEAGSVLLHEHLSMSVLCVNFPVDAFRMGILSLVLFAGEIIFGN